MRRRALSAPSYIDLSPIIIYFDDKAVFITVHTLSSDTRAGYAADGFVIVITDNRTYNYGSWAEALLCRAGFGNMVGDIIHSHVCTVNTK